MGESILEMWAYLGFYLVMHDLYFSNALTLGPLPYTYKNHKISLVYLEGTLCPWISLLNN
jgi:hypothetical protein